MDLNIHSPLPQRKDFRIGILGAGFIVNDCHLVAYRKAGFNPVAIASRTRTSSSVGFRLGISVRKFTENWSRRVTALAKTGSFVSVMPLGC